MGYKKHYVTSGFENVEEFGVFNPVVGKWMMRSENRIVYQNQINPVSLRESFPDADHVGSYDFAVQFLEEILSGKPVFGKYPVGSTDYGFDQIGVYRFTVRRPRYVESGLEIEELKGRGTLFNIRGQRAQIRVWVDSYKSNHPNAVFSTLVSGPSPTVRVWHS